MPTVNCFKCGKSFNKSSSEIRKTSKHFCSKSHANSYNNEVPKRKKRAYKCQVCGETIPQRRKYCDEHHPNRKNWGEITIKQLKGARKYQAHSRIRELARKQYLASTRSKHCLVCNYNKFFHVCHIQSIESFPENTTILIVNDMNNLVALCPNHHWELDNGLLALAEGLEPSSSNYGTSD